MYCPIKEGNSVVVVVFIGILSLLLLLLFLCYVLHNATKFPGTRPSLRRNVSLLTACMIQSILDSFFSNFSLHENDSVQVSCEAFIASSSCMWIVFHL